MIIVNGCKPLNVITKSSILDATAILDPPLSSTLHPRFKCTISYDKNWLKYAPNIFSYKIDNSFFCNFLLKWKRHPVYISAFIQHIIRKQNLPSQCCYHKSNLTSMESWKSRRETRRQVSVKGRLPDYYSRKSPWFQFWFQLFANLHIAWNVSKYGVISGPYFPVFGLNTEIYSVNLRIQSEYRKIRTGNNSAFGHFTLFWQSTVLCL